MFGGFLPPVVFQVTANATQAMATFKGVNTQLKIMEAQALKTGVAMSRFQKAALLGTGVLKGFAIVAAGVAAIGVKSAMDLEKSYNRLGQALTNMGLASEQTRAQLSELMQSYEDLGFGAEQAADAYSVLISANGNVERSNRLLALSADVARAKNIGLESAARLVTRAAAGSGRLFREFGISLDTSKDKTVATEEALAKLEARLGGQAAAYAKTFAGQVAVLNEKIGDLFEAIGLKILPVLTKFIDKLNGAGKFVKDHNEKLVALAATITILLIPAIVNLTKKLVLLAATILRSPIARLAIAIFAVAYAFVRAFNASEDFRKKVGTVVNFALGVVGFLVNAVENIVQVMMLAEKGVLKLGIAWAKFRRDEKRQAELEAELRTWEKQYAAIDKWSDSIENARKKVTDFSGKKLEIKWNFKIPQIPGFGGGDGAGVGIGENAGKELADSIKSALIKAKQAIKDFNRESKQEFKALVANWKDIINRDFASEIAFALDDSVDELIKRTQSAVDAYAKASEGYNEAMSQLNSAQDAYIAAIKTNNEKTIAAAESALKAAENGVTDVMDAIGSALQEIRALQDEIIQAIASTTREINKLEEERTKILEEAQAERTKLEDKYNKTIADIRKKHEEDVASAELEATARRAEIIKTSVNMLRDAFRTATYRSVGDIYDALTFQGRYLKGGTPEKIISALGLQATKAERLAQDAAQLAGLGFTQTFIQEVIALGPDVGHSLAQTIINSTPESIKQLQSYWKQLQTVSNYGVDNLAKQMNSGITLATDELTQQLADVTTELNATLARLDKELTASLAEAFNEYSEALEEINKRTAQQVAEIDRQIQFLTARIAQLEAALLRLQGLGAPGTSGAGVSIIGTIPRLPTTPSGELARATAAAKDAARAEADAALAEAESEAALAAAIAAEAARAAADAAADLARTQGIITRTNMGSGSVANAVMGNQRGNTITVIANTNANPQQIAQDVGWVIRTSGDVQYRTPNPYGGMTVK